MPLKAGFFHFVEEYDAPLPALIREFDKHPDIAGSLIVLPEAFNLGREYKINPCAEGEIRKPPKTSAKAMLKDLAQLAGARDVILVVGLIDDARHNSAYFVSGDSWRFMCHKLNQDSSCEYKCCTESCDGENPVSVRVDHRVVGIGALICMDSIEQHLPQGNRYRHQAEQANERRRKLKCDIVCVPAYWYRCDTWPPREWKGQRVVLANSRANVQCFSAIYDAGGNAVTVPPDKTKNQVCFSDASFMNPPS